MITTKQPVNARIQQCIAAAHEQTVCYAKPVITINVKNYQCNPNGGGCNQYIQNPLCTKISDYKPAKCIAWDYDAPGTHLNKTRMCKTNRNYGHCTEGQQVGYRIDCHNSGTTGLCGVDTHVKWTCTNNVPEQLAVYSCKEPSYNYLDECAGK